MKTTSHSLLALLATLGSVQARESPLADYRTLCPAGQVSGTTTFDNGVTADYACRVKVRSDANPTVLHAGSSGECAALCGSGCSSAVWQYTTNRCLLYDSDGEDENSDEDGEEESDCPHERKACEDELEHAKEENEVCEEEKEGLPSQIDHDSQRYAELDGDLATCKQERDEVAAESATCRQEKDELDLKRQNMSNTCQREKDELEIKSKTCQKERDELDSKSKTCQRDKDTVDTKAKTCEREKGDMKAKTEALNKQIPEQQTKLATCETNSQSLSKQLAACKKPPAPPPNPYPRRDFSPPILWTTPGPSLSAARTTESTVMDTLKSAEITWAHSTDTIVSNSALTVAMR
ncbi:hypothetical protein BJX62DRAFT_232206 [Aspergillus germanicus]